MTTPGIELTGIYIYPVKSLRGVSVRVGPLENGRLVGDRTWLLADEAGWFMHMRDYPQMARVEATITAHGVRVHTGGMPDLEIARPMFNPTTDRITHIQLWRRRRVAVYDRAS